MTDKQVEKVEAYIRGEMNPEERNMFEQELVLDKELATAYQTYHAVEKDMFNPGNDAHEDAVKNTLTNLGTAFFANSPKPTYGYSEKETISLTGSPHLPSRKSNSVKILRTWKLAAAIIIGITVMAGAWYVYVDKKDATDQVVQTPVSRDSAGRYQSNKDTGLQISVLPDSPKQALAKSKGPGNSKQALSESEKQKSLYAKYFQPDTLPVDKQEPLGDAFDLYERRRYKQAVEAFEYAEIELTTRGEQTEMLSSRFYTSYYKAISYMSIGQHTKAIRLFEKISGQDPLVQAKVNWYLSLCYLRTGSLQKAVFLLRELNDNKEAGAYRSAANRLMNDLRIEM